MDVAAWFEMYDCTGWLERVVSVHKGPFKYYVIKKVGGWVRPNAYVGLHDGWVGVARCLRNQKAKNWAKIHTKIEQNLDWY